MQLEKCASLVITAHRSGRMLDACLVSAERLSPAPLEVIVAVDGAAPDVQAAVAHYGFRLVSLPSAPGVSAARNAGAEAAQGDMLLFVDSDVELPVDFIARVALAFDRYPDAAAFIGSYDDAPPGPGIVSRYRNLLHHYTHQLGAREANTFWAACGAIRRDVFRSAGGFNEVYAVPSVEDIELGYRLRRAGQSIRLVPEWEVKHLKTWRFSDLVLTDFMRRALPWSRLLRRERRIDNDLNLNCLSRISAALVCLAACTLVAGLQWRSALIVTAAALILALVMNWQFYRFLAARGGYAFAAMSIPLHWIYFLVGAAGFVTGMALSGFDKEPAKHMPAH